MTPVWIPRAVAGLPALPGLPSVAAHPGVVVHCTGGSKRPQQRTKALERLRIVHASHTRERGWIYAGYHFAVIPSGDVVELRGWGVRGAHAKGHNRWLGVVVLGRGEDMTAEEKAGLEAVFAAHLARGGGAQILPHNAISPKACPGPAVTSWLSQRQQPATAPQGCDTTAGSGSGLPPP